jgi:multicomponent Na+:H+ antiporter subunit E
MDEGVKQARRVLRSIAGNIASTSLVCPLCGSAVPPRGLRPVMRVETPEPRWELVFTCPACGLLSAFSTIETDLKQIKELNGSVWGHELRQFLWAAKEDALRGRAGTIHQYLGVLVVSFLTWLTLTGSLNPLDLFWGLVVSLVVARFSFRLVAFNLPRWFLQPRRWIPFAALLFELFRQLVVQNITLSVRVFRPDLPIRPGIVAVPTRLRGEVNLTILGSMMSLTPDTVTMDIDQENSLIYVHWIDVQTTDPQQARTLISARLEELIIRWLL